MGMPKDIQAIDLMLNIPGEDNSGWYEFMKPLFLDEESRKVFKMPAQYMFKDIPETGKQEDYTAYTIAQMDKHNIQKAMFGITDDNEVGKQALKEYPSRFVASYHANPNNGMDEVRAIEHHYKTYGIKCVTGFYQVVSWVHFMKRKRFHECSCVGKLSPGWFATSRAGWS